MKEKRSTYRFSVCVGIHKVMENGGTYVPENIHDEKIVHKLSTFSSLMLCYIVQFNIFTYIRTIHSKILI